MSLEINSALPAKGYFGQDWGGIRYRSGMFMELKTTVYSDPSPTLRLILGYNF